MAEILDVTNHCDSKSTNITQFGEVGGPEWKFGGQKANLAGKNTSRSQVMEPGASNNPPDPH
eukprot:868480-Pelagomonas_calceolata.AAC.1